MATTVGQHSVSAFATPVNGGPLDANVVRGNDNTIRTAYVAHDADTGIHVQSSSLASRPAAGTAGRKWITEDSGVYTLWFDDGTNWHPVSSENVALTVLAGENLVKGDVVKVTGWNNGQDLPEVVKVSSASDTAFAIITAAVSSGSMGYATNTGIVQDVNTNSFAAGTILYPNTSGGFTSTKPTSGTYQVVAYVLRQNTNNGVIFVEFSAPRIVETSANTASTVVQRDASGNFSAGTITAGALTSTGLVTFASLKGTGATTVTNILDEDNMASDSATALATQQSIKAYVDAKVATVDTLAEVLANGNTTGANDIIVNAGQKIRTPLVAAQDGTSAITIANSTGALTLNTALADSNLATISTAGKVSNSATTATSSNTASAIVARDASGNFTAGTITAALTGNASTATTLQTARNINGVSFNGSADITVTADAGTLSGNTLASGVTASSLTSVGTLTSLTVSAAGNPVSLNNSSAAGLNGMIEAKRGGTARYYIGWDASDNFAILNNTASASLLTLTNGGNLAVDTNTLYVDAANNRVGVGTASPSYVLDVAGRTRLSGTGYSSASSPTLLIDNTTATTGRRYAINSANGGLFQIADDTAGGVSLVLLDASGNLGLGVTPSAWSASGTIFKALQVGAAGSLAGASDNTVHLSGNAYFDGSSWKYLTTAAAANYYLSGATHNWRIAASGTAGNAITFTQAMTLDASGNLSLGTTTPAYLGNPTDISQISVNRVPSTGTIINTGRSCAFINLNGASGGSIIQFATASANNTSPNEAARITSGGYFKASNDGTYFDGTGSYHELRQTSGVNAILVSSNTQSSPYGFEIKFTGASPDNNTNYFLKCEDSTANRTFIYSDGDVWTSDAGTLTSDATLKRDITDATPKLADVMRLKVRNFYWTEDYHPEKQDKKLIGFIAQEFEEVFPGLVSEHAVRGGKPIFEDRPVLDEDGEPVLDEDGIPKVEQVQVGETPKDMRKGLKEGKLIPILVKALQEAVEKIEALEARLEALEA